MWEKQVAARPDAIAIHQGIRRVTYDVLNRLANRWAQALRALGVGEETAVGVCMGQGIEQIAVQLALCKVGGTCVPIDSAHPVERQRFILEDAEAKVLLTERLEEEATFEGMPQQRLCVERDRARLSALPDTFTSAPGRGDQRAYILYTSGTTGKPKGIELLAKGISRLALGTDYVHITPEDRFGQLAHFSFDVALFEIWGPLLTGASMVLIPKASILDVHAFRAALREMKVTKAFMTTALFNVVAQTCPDAFQTLDSLLIGGEKANPVMFRAVHRAGPPRRLMNVYGPTESTTFTTTHVTTADEAERGILPLGRPIANTVVYILGPDLKQVDIGVTGEIFIGGDGLARGYVNRPELTRQRFLDVPGLTPDGAPLRLYKSGDLGKWRADGTIDFVGRDDFQVKVRGFRIEMEGVEAVLLESGLLKSAVVVLKEDALGDKSLVAFVVPKEPGSDCVPTLQTFAQEKLPSAMVPSALHVLEHVPMTVNGKQDRKALTALAGRLAAPVASTGTGWAPRDDTEEKVGALWSTLLGVAEPTYDDDFLRLGGNSLLAARMVMGLRQTLRVGVPAWSLYEARPLRAFLDVVRRARAGASGPSASHGGPEQWREHARLPEDIRLPSGKTSTDVRGDPVEEMDLVFLTGATGFLGAFLLRDLLVRKGPRVACLVRASSLEEGRTRLRQAMEKYGLWEGRFTARLQPVLGDLREPALGLSPEDHAELATRVDALFHVGAQVNYVQPYHAHFAANVQGTTEVLRLAARERVKPVHYVSTIAVFGPTGYFNGTRRIPEDEDLDRYVECLKYDIGYSASKWVAEQRVWEAVERGLPVNVYRPGFIMGDSRSGVGNPDDFVARLIRGCLRIGACPDLPRQRKEFVPVDFVSQALLTIASREGAVGKAFHLVPPRPEESVDMNDFFALLSQVERPLEVLPYGEWVERLAHDPRVAENALCPLLPMLYERVYGGESSSWELFEDMPVFDARHTVTAIAGTGVRFRKMDAVLLHRYLEDWRRKGLLPEEPGASDASVH